MLACTACKAGFTCLQHRLLRYQKRTRRQPQRCNRKLRLPPSPYPRHATNVVLEALYRIRSASGVWFDTGTDVTFMVISLQSWCPAMRLGECRTEDLGSTDTEVTAMCTPVHSSPDCADELARMPYLLPYSAMRRFIFLQHFFCIRLNCF